MSGGYTISGAFNSGSLPGLDAPFFNNIENWIQQLEGDAGSVAISGGSSGTATLYQILQATIKCAVVVLSNFKTGGSNQDIALPTAFTATAYITVTDIVTMSLLLSGSVKNMDVITSIGGSTNNATIASYESAGIKFGFDTIRFTSGASSAHTGIVFIIGV